MDSAITQFSSIIFSHPEAARPYYFRALAFESKKDFVNARKDGLMARKLGMNISDELLNSWH